MHTAICSPSHGGAPFEKASDMLSGAMTSIGTPHDGRLAKRGEKDSAPGDEGEEEEVSVLESSLALLFSPFSSLGVTISKSQGGSEGGVT